MKSATASTAEERGMRKWVRRRPVTTFLVLLFGIGYPLMALPILAHRGVLPGGELPTRLGLDTERFSVLLMMYCAMLPATLWVTWAADGSPGLRGLLQRITLWRVGLGWWLLVVAALPAMTLGLALLLGDTPRPLTASMLRTELVGLLVGFLVVNLWEETAWAGLVQTRLEERHSVWVASLLTAVPFVLIHMPFQFIGDFSAVSVLVGFVALLIFASVFRLLIAFVLRGTGSLLAVGLLHTIFNRSNNSDGIVAQLVEGGGRMVAALIATVILTFVAGMLVRRRLSSKATASGLAPAT